MTSSISDSHPLLGFCPPTSRSPGSVTLPEPHLPPRMPGGKPISLSQAQAERAAAERKAQARERTSNGYPFWTKREIIAKLSTEPSFRHEAMLVLFQRQTDDEVVERDTKWLNKRGFMSSHAVHGTRISELILAGNPLDEEDEDRVLGMVVRYSKQLAAHYRQQMLREHPELADQAAKFGIGVI